MKNREKYTTPEDQVLAFQTMCRTHYDACQCNEYSTCKYNKTGHDDRLCLCTWLEDEADQNSMEILTEINRKIVQRHVMSNSVVPDLLNRFRKEILEYYKQLDYEESQKKEKSNG